jgi:four helix bundle protein
MKTAETFADLIVWQKSHALVLDVYRMTSQFPTHEIYGLSAQLRRAAISVPANIAEGFKKRGRADKLRYLNIAQGSLEETRYYLVLARDLGYAAGDSAPDVGSVSQLLHKYVGAIRNSA